MAQASDSWRRVVRHFDGDLLVLVRRVVVGDVWRADAAVGWDLVVLAWQRRRLVLGLSCAAHAWPAINIQL